MPLSTEDKTQVKNFVVMSVIAIGFLIMAPLSEYGIGIRELRTKVGVEEKLLAQAKQDLQQEQARIERIPVLEKELQEREPEIRRYEARLPKDRKVPDLFKDIDRFKQQSNLDITVQTRLEPVDKEDYLELRIRVEARGDYDSIASFINFLERNQRFAQIKELEIVEAPGQNNDEELIPEDLTIHDAVMVVSTFMFVDQEEEPEEEAG
jgi:Tfp pilus assembly protein PilO